jgi:hypothetical protein
MQLSFACLTLALLCGVKQVTRRDWSPRTVRLFEKALELGEPVAAFDRQARFGGKQVATLVLTGIQDGELPAAIPPLDWELGGVHI